MSVTNLMENIGNPSTGPISSCFLTGKLNSNYLSLPKTPFLKYSKTKPLDAFKQQFAPCGEWRMGWTTLFQTILTHDSPCI